ncbi:MAG: DUF5367 family protein [Cyclobacteriaceae bacterium]
MKNLNFKRAVLAAIMAWTLGVAAFVASYFVPVMDDADQQANMVLLVMIIPAAALGARVYYQKVPKTNGFLLGSCMFLITIALDAGITVPLFIIPAGGNHITFFSDPSFWLIGIEYICVVAVYCNLSKTYQSPKTSV